MTLNSLYHWSPSENRKRIKQEGLKIGKSVVTHSAGMGCAPYLCFACSPSQAWKLSGNMSWVSEIDQWDLWEFWPDQKQPLTVCPVYGNILEEVRCYNSVPANQLWLVGHREPECFE